LRRAVIDATDFFWAARRLFRIQFDSTIFQSTLRKSCVAYFVSTLARDDSYGRCAHDGGGGVVSHLDLREQRSRLGKGLFSSFSR
jgi:hypothetical protein